MSDWSNKEAKLLVQRIGAMIMDGEKRTIAIYAMLEQSLDEAYNRGVADAMAKDLKS